MSEVARRCLECGTSVRDLTSNRKDERDSRSEGRERLKTAVMVAAVSLLGVVVTALTVIGGATVLLVTGLTWPWLPWA